MNVAYEQAVKNGSIPVLDFAVYFPYSSDKVLGKVMRYADKIGYCFASIDRIAWECGVSKSLAKLAIKFLEEKLGFIECTGGAKGGTHVTKKFIMHYDAIYEMQELWKASKDSEPPVIEIIELNGKSKKKTVKLEYLKYQTSQNSSQTSQNSYANQSDSDYKESSKKEYKKQFADAHDYSKPQEIQSVIVRMDELDEDEQTITKPGSESGMDNEQLTSMPNVLNEDKDIPVTPDTKVPETKDECFAPTWQTLPSKAEAAIRQYGSKENAIKALSKYNRDFKWEDLDKPVEVGKPYIKS